MTDKELKRMFKRDIKEMREELKYPYISYEREEELKTNIETLEEELKRL